MNVVYQLEIFYMLTYEYVDCGVKMANCPTEPCKYVLLGSSYISRLETEFRGDLKVLAK
jgi:hypothetical protein